MRCTIDNVNIFVCILIICYDPPTYHFRWDSTKPASVSNLVLLKFKEVCIWVSLVTEQIYSSLMQPCRCYFSLSAKSLSNILEKAKMINLYISVSNKMIVAIPNMMTLKLYTRSCLELARVNCLVILFQKYRGFIFSLAPTVFKFESSWAIEWESWVLFAGWWTWIEVTGRYKRTRSRVFREGDICAEASRTWFRVMIWMSDAPMFSALLLKRGFSVRLWRDKWLSEKMKGKY